MGIKRVTIRIRPGIITGSQFIENIQPVINLMKEKSSHFYAWCLEENNKEEEIMIDNDSKEFHFHGCFITWKNEGNPWFEKKFQECMDWNYFVEMKAVDANSTRPALMVNGMTRKNTEQEFVGYLFKEPSTGIEYNGYKRSDCIGWDREQCLTAYQKGLQEATIGWHCVWEYAEQQFKEIEDEYEEHFKEGSVEDNYNTMLAMTTKKIIRKYKGTISVGMVLNIRRLLEKTIS